MVFFPNAKINIGLNIIGKRADGFHNLETIFYPVAVKDALEMIENTTSSKDVIFSSSGNIIKGNTDDNLCIKAIRLVKKDFQLPPLKVHLHKNIPMGAGMGGGSSDASAILLLLNKKFQLDISPEKLMEYALLLGSDCPFFMINKPCFASGRGEILHEINLDLYAYKILIVHPGIHVNTGDAFAQLNAATFSPAGELIEKIKMDITQWMHYIKNDFEESVFEKHLAIKEIKDKLYNEGAIYSAMSGSGSAVFGIFPKKTDASNIKFPSHYFCQIV
ncbi:MAG: 4-(cytidine 5'-diphospho)-2-C-methyl-D-erythritol kinase [Ferruginibacter sp.]